jgi:transcriptional repressor NrdR
MMEKEVNSSFVGELIMEKLKDVDEVAYVRFASVYRQFTDVNTFVAEVEKLLSKKE